MQIIKVNALSSRMGQMSSKCKLNALSENRHNVILLFTRVDPRTMEASREFTRVEPLHPFCATCYYKHIMGYSG